MNIEEFVSDYLQEHRHDILLNPYNGLIDFANAFKEQMLKDAVDGWLDEDNTPPYDLNIVCREKIPCGKFKHCDNVKLIVVKED